MSKIRFDETARSERYFTATLLSHLLMVNEFAGLKALFKKLNIMPDNTLSADIEIVTELDPLRDGAKAKGNIKDIFKERGRVAVPDLFLRWGNQILVIEAKFFTAPTVVALADQVTKQHDAIAMILDETQYSHCEIKCALLTVNEVRDEDELLSGISQLTWTGVIDILRDTLGEEHQSNIDYCFKILENAVKRSEKELISNVADYRLIANIGELLKALPELIVSEELFVGYTGGIDALEIAELATLEQRKHYKVSRLQPNSNWVRIDVVIKKYLDLKLGSDSSID
ncbi:hypothetical protein [Moritella sp. F3]|uniref:hypothetical protein n=1 Tax=Moritella sp. F3 TaxID=2718882 RepID=UPI0018E1791B|nr:hypothetical protein [Moritella sp. F3]GIC79258.1 hypothetical protein FMO001_39850 [Moritella sp. F1]GIC80417.1 hypothetical protein FMO003_06980 [Moritella sp. F3]